MSGGLVGPELGRVTGADASVVGGSHATDTGAGRERVGCEALAFEGGGTCCGRWLARRLGGTCPADHFRTQGDGAGLATRHKSKGGGDRGGAGFALRALTSFAEVRTTLRRDANHFVACEQAFDFGVRFCRSRHEERGMGHHHPGLEGAARDAVSIMVPHLVSGPRLPLCPKASGAGASLGTPAPCPCNRSPPSLSLRQLGGHTHPTSRAERTERTRAPGLRLAALSSRLGRGVGAASGALKTAPSSGEVGL